MDVRRTSLSAGETRTRILDAALALFVTHGFEATSTRMITGAAGVNLAAVNYHFGSKDVLVQEVLRRHLHPLNEKRMDALDAAERAAGDRPVRASLIMEAFFGGSLELAAASTEGRAFMRLLGRTFTEPSPQVRAFLSTEYAAVISRYKLALQRALPAVPLEEIVWRLHFMLGAMSYAVSGIDSLQVLTGVHVDEPDAMQRMAPRLMNFLLGGLRAPLPGMEGRID
jgi:AcrR family transcriptional regulator